MHAHNMYLKRVKGRTHDKALPVTISGEENRGGFDGSPECLRRRSERHEWFRSAHARQRERQWLASSRLLHHIYLETKILLDDLSPTILQPLVPFVLFPFPSPIVIIIIRLSKIILLNDSQRDPHKSRLKRWALVGRCWRVWRGSR